MDPASSGSAASCGGDRWRCCRPGAVDWAGLPDIAPFLAEAAKIDVLLSGWARRSGRSIPALRAALEAAGLGVEIMATPSACRTYNVLLGEGRRIAAGLLPV